MEGGNQLLRRGKIRRQRAAAIGLIERLRLAQGQGKAGIAENSQLHPVRHFVLLSRLELIKERSAEAHQKQSGGNKPFVEFVLAERT